MLKKLFIAGVFATFLVGVIVYVKLEQFGTMEHAAAEMLLPPETVTAATVSKADWEQVIAATGTVSAVQGVTVSAEAGGRVTQIMFESATNVEKGQVLLQLDTSSEDSQLASAKAAAALARADLKRLRRPDQASAGLQSDHQQKEFVPG